MYFLKWKDKYKVGVSLVDYQHKELFNCYNMALQTYFDDYQKTHKHMIENLINYGYYHFKTEELIYDIFGMEYSEHKEKHNDFVKHIISLQNSDHNKVIDLETINFVRDWLINHILTEDADMFKKLEFKNIFHKIGLNLRLYYNYILLRLKQKTKNPHCNK